MCTCVHRGLTKGGGMSAAVGRVLHASSGAKLLSGSRAIGGWCVGSLSLAGGV